MADVALLVDMAVHDGWVKLGQPQPELNLASDSNRVWPQPAQV